MGMWAKSLEKLLPGARSNRMGFWECGLNPWKNWLPGSKSGLNPRKNALQEGNCGLNPWKNGFQAPGRIEWVSGNVG